MDGMDETPDLIAVEIDDALGSLLERYPLPRGVMDADMNQEEIAQSLNTTVNTVAKWIRQDGMPVVQQGGNGKAYILRLSHCYAWKKGRDAAVSLQSQHNKAQINALQAEFLGMDTNSPMAGLSAKQRDELAAADIRWSRAQHLRKQLVPLADVVSVLEAICTKVREGIEAMPDRLERELNLKPEEVAAVVRIGEDVLQTIHDRIEEAELNERDIADVEVQTQWMI